MPDFVGSGQTAATDYSGTIASGDTAQVLMPANGSRRGVFIQNVSDTDMWINELGADAVKNQPSIKIVPGASYTATTPDVPVAAISIICATTGKAFTAREW